MIHHFLDDCCCNDDTSEKLLLLASSVNRVDEKILSLKEYVDMTWTLIDSADNIKYSE